MDQRAVLIFESKQRDFAFQYHMPIGATWEDATKAAHDIFGGLQAYIKDLQDKADAEKKSEPITPEVVERKEA